MGNCSMKRTKRFNPGAVLDRVIASASPEDECLLYRLANFKKSGQMVEAFNTGGSKEVEKIMKAQFGALMYNQGRGELITKTEYLRWKFRNNDKISIDEKKKTIYDPLHSWVDHDACWKMNYRGSLGESLLHVLIICDSPIHTRIARILLKCFPRCAVDMVEGEEYLGATGLHLAIAYGNDELADILVQCGVSVRQRAMGVFFMPTDQQSNKPVVNTTYEGLAYMGEYPLAWSACLANETIYNLLLEEGADPDDQDTYGNTVLHMVVVTAQLGMYGYSLRHPRKNANPNIRNKRGLTCLTLSCELGRDDIFREMLELSCTEFWRYSNITCCGYPLGALDSIQADGETNWGSALMIILAGKKAEHLNMLEGGIIAKLLEEKWKTFAQGIFMRRMALTLLHLITMSMAIYTRPDIETSLLTGIKEGTDPIKKSDISRYCFEIATLLSCTSFMLFQLGSELQNAGMRSFLKSLCSAPAKMSFVISNLLIMACVPVRMAQLGPEYKYFRTVEEALLVFGVPGSWFYLMFFAGAIKLTGPFVTMIFSMITGDMFTFSIIYAIFLFGFSQAFYFIIKGHPEADLYKDYGTTWIGLFHMTLGEYNYDTINGTPYSAMAKIVFVLFQILIPILLLNMLIAMMGNTYAIVIEKSEKEYLKQWAKVIMSMERSVPPHTCKEYIEEYSIKLGATERGVMVIKSKDKTRARQRKGALSNWKKTGKTVIKYLKKRNITGDDLRREMWVHDEVETPRGVRKKKGRGYDVSFALGEAEPHVTQDGNNLGSSTENRRGSFLYELGEKKPNGSAVTVSGGQQPGGQQHQQPGGQQQHQPTSSLPPIDDHKAPYQAAPGEASALVSELSAGRTPGGGIKGKRTKQQRREELFKKKRSRKALNKQLLSLDLGFAGPEDSDSSDDDLFLAGYTLTPDHDHTQHSLPPSRRKGLGIKPLEGQENEPKEEEKGGGEEMHAVESGGGVVNQTFMPDDTGPPSFVLESETSQPPPYPGESSAQSPHLENPQTPPHPPVVNPQAPLNPQPPPQPSVVNPQPPPQPPVVNPQSPLHPPEIHESPLTPDSSKSPLAPDESATRSPLYPSGSRTLPPLVAAPSGSKFYPPHDTEPEDTQSDEEQQLIESRSSSKSRGGGLVKPPSPPPEQDAGSGGYKRLCRGGTVESNASGEDKEKKDDISPLQEENKEKTKLKKKREKKERPKTAIGLRVTSDISNIEDIMNKDTKGAWGDDFD